MIVTVENILKLPSLADAKVVAGYLYLWKKITAVKVLRPSAQSGGYEEFPAFSRNDLIVTSFDEIWGEPLLQRSFIKQMVRAEASGVVVFSNVPGRNSLNEDIINEADENCLPVLCVPGRSNPLLCGQLVGDIDNILRETESEGTLAVTMLEMMSRGHEWEQSIQTAADLLSEWMSTSILLTDGTYRVLAEKVYAPANNAGLLEEIRATAASGLEIPPLVDGCYVYTTELHDTNSKLYRLFLLRTVRIEQQEFRTAINAMQLALNFWTKQSAGASTFELTSAMLQDEPLKKCRLAALLRIDVAQLDCLWIVHSADSSGKGLQQKLEALKEVVDCRNTQVLMDIYEKCIVMFLAMPPSLEEIESLQNDILQAVEEKDVLFCINNLQSTDAVRNIYAGYQRTFADIIRIYPCCRVLSSAHMNMALECRTTMVNAQNFADSMLAPLHKISGKTKVEDMKQFLTTYLLDANLDINCLSQMTYLHRNTVKYRIKALSDVFGFNLGTFPDTEELMLAVAIERLRGTNE